MPPKKAARRKTKTVRRPRGAPQIDAAQVLHNGISQTLTGVQLCAGVIARKLAATQPGLSREVAELGEILQRARDELQDVVHALRGGKKKKARR